MVEITSKTCVKKVVFIDDDDATNAYHSALAKEYNLAETMEFYTSAESALTALAAITDKHAFPELIFVDINMPKMDGHEFASELQKMPGYNEKRTCIALLTNSRDIRDVITADQNMVEHYYWKPLNQDLLKQVLKEGLNIDLNP